MVVTGPASPLQAQMWAVDRLRGGDTGYLTAEALRIDGSLDAGRLRECLAHLTRRHEALRTGFHFDGERLLQVRAEPGTPELETYDLPTASDPTERFTDIVREALRHPLPLDRPPLTRWLLGTAGSTSYLGIVLHHIVADGWSVDILFEELGALYLGDDLPPPPPSYGGYARDLVERISNGSLEGARRYWSATLDGAPAASPIAGVGLRPSGRGGHELVSLPPSLVRAVSEFAGRSGATPYMVHFAALALLMAARGGRDDLVIGMPAANRGDETYRDTAGPFMNPLPVRVQLPDGLPRMRLLHGVRDAILGAVSHQELPLSAIVKQHPTYDASSLTPMFQVMAAPRVFATGSATFSGHATSRLRFWTDTAKYDLVLTFPQDVADPAVLVEYDLGRYDTRFIADLVGDYVRTLRVLLDDPHGQCAAPPVDDAFGVHHRVRRTARRHPSRPAVVQGTAWLSYRELDERSGRVAAGLRRRGIRPRDVVMVSLPRGPEFITAILGVLSAGAAYLPADPSWPEERLAHVLGACRAGITDARRPPGGPAVPLWSLDDLASDADGAEACVVCPGDAAYVIYTSGSTGVPKPVAVPHGSLDRLLAPDQPFAVEPDARVAHISNLAFDASVFEIWCTLTAGGTLVVPAWQAPAPHHYADLFAECTTALVTTGLFAQLVRHRPTRAALRRLDLLIVGGDVLDPAAARLVVRAGSRQLNAYGVTEATVISTTAPLDAVTDRHTAPIGTCLPNTHVHVLDGLMRPVPDGAPGALYVGGGLALGYLHGPGATAERFRPDPCGGGERVYATGDWARRLPDGSLDFMGRYDRQIKLRGHRVELDEIETALRAADGVATARVVVRDPGTANTRLVAVVQPLDDDQPVHAEALSDLLRRKLPAFMRPHEVHVVAAIPLTSSGKVDLDGLALLGHRTDATRPRAELTETPPIHDLIRNMWQTALGAPVADDVDFFRAGGDSMDAIGLLVTVDNELGVAVAPNDLFANPTLGEFIAYVEGLLPAAREHPFPAEEPA